MQTSVNLNAYFERIGFLGDARPDLATLQKLQLLHVQRIPFENLNPLLKMPVPIDLASLQEKLVDDQRGGYCFEQNLFFNHVLKAIGFDVATLAARVLWNTPDDAITTKSHVLLMLDIAGATYLVDVGFGGQSLTGPLKFEMDTVQETPHEDYRILKKGGYFLAQTAIQGEWKNMYRFTLNPHYFVDYKVANWYTATHPDSHFTKKLTVARAGEGCRYVLNNNQFTIHQLNGESQQKTLKSPNDIKEILTDVFRLKLPQTENLDSALQKLGREGES